MIDPSQYIYNSPSPSPYPIVRLPPPPGPFFRLPEHHLHRIAINRVRFGISTDRRRVHRRSHHGKGGVRRGSIRRERRDGRRGIADRHIEPARTGGGSQRKREEEAGGVRGTARASLQPPAVEGIGMRDDIDTGTSRSVDLDE